LTPIIAMQPEHRAFVVCTWAKSASYGLRRPATFRLVDRVLDDSGARVVCIAHGRTVHAWACGDGDVLHYAYTAPELDPTTGVSLLRGRGLARRLITELFGEYPEHITTSHEWPRESARFRYVPNLLLTRTAA